MGQLVTTVVGGVAGFLIGGPMGASIGMTLGGMVGSTLFGPTIKGPRLNDLKVSASTYGTAIPEVYGTVRIGGNMIWTSGIKETKKTSRAGKGGPKQTTYSYDASFAIGLCKGPIDNILRIWADGKLIYDTTAGATRAPSSVTSGSAILTQVAIAAANSKKKKNNYNIRIYRGDEQQLPDSIIEADKGVGNVSAHRGMAYVVFERMELENFGNRIPQLTFEISKTPSDTLPTIEATDSDGSNHPNWAGGWWIPDWELGRLFSSASAGGTHILDLATMQTLYKTSGLNFSGDDRFGYMPGLARFARTGGLRNSAPLEIWDARTLSQIESFGVTSNSTSGFVDYENERYALGNIGHVGFCRNGTNIHYLTTTWRRYTWCIAPGAAFPLFTDRPPFQPNFYMEGQTGTGTSDIIGWRGANGQLEVLNYFISAGANFQVITDTQGNQQWASGPFIRNEHYLNPFGESFTARVCLYDKTDDCLFAIVEFADGEIGTFKWQRSSGTYKFFRKLGTNLKPVGPMYYSRIAGGTFGWGNGGSDNGFLEIDLQNGALLRENPIGSDFGNLFEFGSNQQWDDVSSSLLVETEDRFRRIFFRAGIDNLSVASIVSDICDKTGILEPQDYDVSGITRDPITGYIIDRETTARDVLRQLATGFLFDGYESDYQLKFRTRGDASQVTIPEEYIARDSDMNVVKETIAQELEMPMRVTVNYYDITRDHQQGSQSVKRLAAPVPTMLTSKEDIIDLPITWTPDEAKQTADRILKMAWAQRASYQMELPWRYLKYDPTDVATVELESGTVYEMRFNEVLIGADFKLAIKAQSEKAAAYVSNLTGAVGDVPLQTIGLDYPATPLILNTPLLRDLDYDSNEFSRCYLTASTNALRFNGAAIFINDGLEYAALGVIDDQSIAGFTTSLLPPTRSWGSTDENTVLVVRLIDSTATLESITQEDMLNTGANAALVGDEVIQFRDAVLQSDGSWHLTGILRARRGTNYAVNDHVLGENFLLLDPERLISFIRPPEDYNVFREFKAVPAGTLVEDAETFGRNLTPRDLQPLTPEDIEVTDDDTTVTISMQRRSRVIAPLADGTGTIPYREGDKPSAKINYSVWPGLGLADIEPVADAGISGSFSLFDAAGADAPAEFSFTLTELGVETRALVRLAEVGAVEGIPKWVEIERIGTDLWNIDEFY